ncbi:MAG: DUF2911 domain-containing protein [Salinibacter sp.]
MSRLRPRAFLIGFAIGALLLGPVLPTLAQERGNTVPRVSPNATVSQTIGVTTVKITYGRPSVQGRDIFGGLVPFGTVWRTGANEATTVSVSTPVRVQGERLPAGTYGFFTIPGPDAWTLIFNAKANQWGAYNYDSSQDVLRVQAPPRSADSKELMTFSFENVTDTSAAAVLHWAETRVPFSITVNTPEVVRTRAAEAMASADDWRAPLQYVRYALRKEVLLDAALDWVNRSVEMEKRYLNLRMKAEVLAANEQYGPAVEAGRTALKRAESMDDPPDNLDELRSRVQQWASNV